MPQITLYPLLLFILSLTAKISINVFAFNNRYLMGDLLNEINFNEFEEEFKVPQKKPKGSDIIKDHVDGKGNPIKKPEAEPSKPKLKSLMEHTRLRNIAICTRKLPSMPIPELIKAINSLDIQVMRLYSSYSLLIHLLF